MQNQLKQLQELFQSKKYAECADAAEKLVSRGERNLPALLFLAQAQIQLNDLVAAQNILNDIYSKIKRGPEDALFYNALLTQETLAIQLQVSTNSAQNRKKGKEIHLTNKFQIIDFLDQKKRYDQMIQQTDVYCLLLIEENRYKDVEDTYLWLMRHPGLTKDVQAQYGLRVFEIDPFYKPITKPDFLLAEVSKIIPGDSKLSGLATKIFDTLDNNNSKKTLLAVTQTDTPQAYKDFEDFSKQLIMAGDIVFQNPSAIFATLTNSRMFIRYTGIQMLALQFLSPEWHSKISSLRELYESDNFKGAASTVEKQQITLLLISLIDVTKIISQSVIPEFKDLLVSTAGTLGEIQELLTRNFGDTIGVSPFVNIYLAISATAKNGLFEQDIQTTLSRIKQAQFLLSKQQKIKGVPPQKLQDVEMYLDCLKLTLKLDKAQNDANFKSAEENYQKMKDAISEATSNLYLSLTVELKWLNQLASGDWVQAIKSLKQIAVIDPERIPFVAIKTCEIQLQYLSQLCDTQEQEEAQIKAIFNTLQGFGESESLLIQGYLLYQYPNILESDQKAALNKWLLALKKDQTNPDTFYSLGVYYFSIGDLKRSSGCLDKALKLRGGFELALVLAYHITQNPDEKLAIVDRFMESNRSSAVSYFFRGLLMQQNKDFIQAIEMFQNAMKFDTIVRQRPQKKNLLPQVSLPISENPFGIFGSQGASICWVYLSDCFFKIEKPSVALKCFTQAILDMGRLVPKEQIEPNKDVTEILQIINFEKFHPSQLEMKNDPILKLLQVLKPQKWALECLILGSKFVSSAQHSISILQVALRCLPASNIPTGVLAFILTEIVDKITSLINTGVVIEEGVARLYAESSEMIRRLQLLVEFCIQKTELDSNINLQKKVLNALFIISQRTQDEKSCLQAMDRADYLMTILETKLFQRTFLLDTCKIIHEYRRFSTSEHFKEKKLTLLKQAIRLEPTKAKLWVHLYLFSEDEQVQAKAIFKAYELEPESAFVQEHILRFFLKTKQWQKAFKILVRSYQQATDNNLQQQPIVLATLAYLNVMCYIEFNRKEQLQEAISLIKMIQREDMKTLLSELLIYLKHFDGDYVPTLNYLSKNPTTENNLLLLKAFFGASVTTLDQAKDKINLVEQSRDMLVSIFETDQLENHILKEKCDLLIESFFKKPYKNASTLALYQEICLQKGVIPTLNVLDNDEAKRCLSKLSHDMQHQLLVQSLRLIQRREGKIPEAEKIFNPDGTFEEVKHERTYTNFIVDMSRFKPQNLTAIQYRALFRLYANSQMDQSILQGIFNNDRSQIKDQNRMQGLNIILSQRREDEDNSQSELMRNPLSIEANTKWLWSLLRAGKLDQALRGHELLQNKIQLGIMSGDGVEFNKLTNFIASINSMDNISPYKDNLTLISRIAVYLQGNNKQSQYKNLSSIAAKIVQSIKRLEEHDQAKIIYLLCKTLELTLQDQGHFAVFTGLLKELLQLSTIAKLSANTINILWNYQLLSTASSMIETMKVTKVSAICKDATQVSQQGFQKRSTFPVSLTQARMYLAAKNHGKVIETLKVDEAVLERDFLIALSFYAEQQYKEYYLLCIGLVAGAKASHDASWQLAYAYYLKAFAEMTFLCARKMGVTLKEDFDKFEGDFDAKFFKIKASTSLAKCRRALINSGVESSLIKEAIETMETQLKEDY